MGTVANQGILRNIDLLSRGTRVLMLVEPRAFLGVEEAVLYVGMRDIGRMNVLRRTLIRIRSLGVEEGVIQTLTRAGGGGPRVAVVVGSVLWRWVATH